MPQVNIDQAMQIAIGHHQAGQLGQADAIYRQVLAVQPNHADALHMLGLVAGQSGRPDVAVELIGRAIAIAPSNPVFHCNCGLLLQNLGRVEEAVGCYRRALALQPGYANAHFNLALAMQTQGHLEAAIISYQQVLALQPNYGSALNNLGNIWQQRSQFDKAADCFKKALELDPRNAEAHNNLAVVMQAQKRFDQAAECCRRALAINPQFLAAHENLGIALMKQGALDEALGCFQQLLSRNPGDLTCAKVYNDMGTIWQQKEQYDEAAACYQRALALDPGLASGHYNLGLSHQKQGRVVESAACYLRALALKPDDPDALSNLASAQRDMGQIDEAIGGYRRAMELDPKLTYVHDSLLLALHYSWGLDPQEILSESHKWNLRHARPLAGFILPHPNDRNPDRRLRVGYVSPDFCFHAVAPLALPLLAHLDPQAIEVFCYAEVARPDPMTERFRACTNHWRPTLGLSDERMADLIRQDQIDILVDLAGHTGGNRLLVFARKPAPVQVTWLGFPGTSGLEAIDYRLTDAYADPPGFTDTLNTERLIRLVPTNWVYQPDANMPEPRPLPEGGITFGCFNNFAKINEPMLRLWAAILAAVPDSRLLLKARGLASPELRQRVQSLLQSVGIALDRVDLRSSSPSAAEHLATFGQVGIALDPFPYHGTASTCEALCMGVPVVTLAGQTHVSRVGVSLLSNMGLPELIASTPEEYVRIAIDLAGDRSRLIALRSTLRQRMRQSPIMDFARFARNVESEYRAMWHKWCAP